MSQNSVSKHSPDTDVSRVGAIAIGRNEGPRLETCLRSLERRTATIVYVDSGSIDDSLEIASRYSAKVVELDTEEPFTAARARNEGFRKLRESAPDVRFIQFVDGDCEIVAGWLETATAFLDQNPSVAVACGRRRERFPERSIYNLLCDIEWDTPVGEASTCGGDALVRVDAFENADGFRSDLIAGEEPELCVRLREQGWKVWRLDQEMTLHDAAMTRFRQWWKRSVRAGHAFAEGAHLHGKSRQRHWVADTRRIWFWGLGFPVGLLVFSAIYPPALLLFLAFPLQVLRLALNGKREARENWLYAVFLVLGKFPEAFGQLTFFFKKLSGIKSKLIEYK